MKPSSFENAIRLQFDCLARKVVGTTVKDYNRELGRIAGIIYKAQDQYVSIALVPFAAKTFQKFLRLGIKSHFLRRVLVRKEVEAFSL